MAGKAIGDFSFKAITSTYNAGPAGSVLNQVNWEGTAAGFWNSLRHGYLRRWFQKRDLQRVLGCLPGRRRATFRYRFWHL
jgi:hypothetical protein